MTDRIALLPEHVANQIAAGEVVQRPASVVKELMENAVDAGAAHIRLIVKDGGKTLVQVVDDGCGMSPADAELCFRRHATSKIREAADLFRLHTKGFRGEALASVAAIAHVELITREPDSELATRVRLAGDSDPEVVESVGPAGTSVSVKNLFFNIPARRNFLKSSQVEYRHVLEEFQRVALAHPGIAFALVHNDTEVHQLPVANLRQRIGHLFGSRMHDRLVPVAETTQIADFGGFVCKPEFARKSRGEQYFFVNDRFIRSPYLHHAVLSAFEGLLRPDTHPGYFIFLRVPEGSVDINIHPTKTEVKFEDEQSLYAILRSAVKHSLGQFKVGPEIDFDQDPNLDTPYAYKDLPGTTPRVEVDPTFNPFRTAEPRAKTYAAPKAAGWEALYEGLPAVDLEESPPDTLVIPSDPQQGTLLDPEDRPAADQSGIFQVGRRFLLARIKSGAVLVHQHRAHQRILYEKFLRSTTGSESATQTLMFPLELELSPADRMVLTGMQESLADMGFRFSDAAGDTVSITGLPALVPESEAEAVLDGLIAHWEQHDGYTHFSQNDRMAKALCRSLAVPSGAVLEPEAQQALVNDLFACKEPAVSPFRKTVFITLSLEELEQKFN